MREREIERENERQERRRKIERAKIALSKLSHFLDRNAGKMNGARDEEVFSG